METRPSRWAHLPDSVLGVGTLVIVLFPRLLLMMVFNTAVGSGQVQAACSKITCSIAPSTLPDSSATSILPSLCKTSAVCPDQPLHRNTFNLCLSFFPLCVCVCLISDLLPAQTDFYCWYLSGGSFVSFIGGHAGCVSARGALKEMTVFQGKDVGVTPAYDVNGPVLSPRGIVLKQMVACVAKVVGSVTSFVFCWGVLEVEGGKWLTANDLLTTGSASLVPWVAALKNSICGWGSHQKTTRP